MKRLLIVQPYLAMYRRPFFARLQSRLAQENVEVTFAFGEPDAGQGARGDSTHFPGSLTTPVRRFRFGSVTLRAQNSWKLASDFDAVVLEASGSLLDTSILSLRRSPTGLWGHIKSYTGPANRLDAAVESWQVRRAAVVLAYTEEGRDEAIARGAHPERALALGNTIDTSGMLDSARSMTEGEARKLLGLEDWADRPTVAFLGGIDPSKRIDFLAQALNSLWDRSPNIRVVVAGRGESEALLAPAVARGQARLVGRVDDRGKAAISKVTAVLINPGRVGLLAVDSLAMGLPIITTDWPFHAPEFFYLRPGTDCLVTPNDLESFVDAIVDVMADGQRLADLKGAARSRSGEFSLDAMTEKFVAGVRILMSSGR